ncbi:MAG: hypothetical protein M4579_000839 [Chaenotheca gracillima]|nr:MAG: hypothetical protein M4579_000839 [Chaenotheca gracillima]
MKRSSSSGSSGTNTDADAMSPAALPAIITPALLSSIRSQPQLPKHTWYFIAGVTLSVINRPDEIPKVFNQAINPGNSIPDTNSSSHSSSLLGHDEQLRIARRMREALIKMAPIAGLPKAINALYALKSATPVALQDPPLSFSPTSRPSEVYDMPSSTILHRGAAYFDKIYGKVAKRVMGQMDRSGTEDLGLTARLMYGYLLSNLNVLTGQESSFVLIAGLIPQDVNPQLKGHLKGALNHGATVEEVKAVREVVIRICEASGMNKVGNNVPSGWGWRGEVANL